ncbi:hypothetical protein BDV41DRAFT_440986 [Aspergillus transmontanensis]|uniref:Uncharacterized protein n=1 Tax=Aspergillus transmontanensis TaxID=1034304 RepID=A0A5N6WDH0_9EURO|nr:hypothetical protein BDV41DRAFT_440986 [Aspergillus transmontanensis]
MSGPEETWVQVMWLIHLGRAFFFFFFFFSVFFYYFLPFLIFYFLYFLLKSYWMGILLCWSLTLKIEIVPFLWAHFSQFPSLYCLCLQTRYTSGSKIAPPALCPLCAEFRIHEIVSEILQWLKEKKKLLLL